MTTSKLPCVTFAPGVFVHENADLSSDILLPPFLDVPIFLHGSFLLISVHIVCLLPPALGISLHRGRLRALVTYCLQFRTLRAVSPLSLIHSPFTHFFSKYSLMLSRRTPNPNPFHSFNPTLHKTFRRETEKSRKLRNPLRPSRSSSKTYRC